MPVNLHTLPCSQVSVVFFLSIISKINLKSPSHSILRKTCLPETLFNSSVYKDNHPKFLAYKCGKIFFIKLSLKTFMFAELLFFFFTDFYRFVLISTCFLYLYNLQIKLRLWDLPQLQACRYDKMGISCTIFCSATKVKGTFLQARKL